MQLKNLLITINLLLVFLACSSARAEDPIVGAWEGTMYCGIKMNGTWYIEKTGQNKYRALAYGYAHPDAPSIQDNCTVDDVIQTQSDQFRFHTRRWLLQPAGYSTEYDTIGTLVDENTMDVKSLHPRCDKARFVRTNTPKPLPAACIRKAPVVYLFPGLIADVPRVFTYSGGIAPDLTCDTAQSRYLGKLLGYAEMGREIKGKQAYFATATFLGYFSDDPVEMEEIAERTKKTIDADFMRMKDVINAEHYFLFVGTDDLTGDSWSGVWDDREIDVQLPKYSTYDWEKNLATFSISKSTISSDKNFLMPSAGEDYHEHTISVSAREWRDRFSKYFGDVSRKGGNRDLYAARILSNEDHFIVLAEIFDKKSGKSIVRWSPNGSDVNEMAKLVPEKPLADYNFNPRGCSNLNTAYFKSKKKK